MSALRIETWAIENTGYLGTTVKITIVINIAIATTARITITGSYDDLKVNDGVMTKEADYVYSYRYQSIEGGDAGRYIATIEIIDSTGKVCMDEKSFDLAPSALE